MGETSAADAHERGYIEGRRAMACKMITEGLHELRVDPPPADAQKALAQVAQMAAERAETVDVVRGLLRELGDNRELPANLHLPDFIKVLMRAAGRADLV